MKNIYNGKIANYSSIIVKWGQAPIICSSQSQPLENWGQAPILKVERKG